MNSSRTAGTGGSHVTIRPESLSAERRAIRAAVQAKIDRAVELEKRNALCAAEEAADELLHEDATIDAGMRSLKQQLYDLAYEAGASVQRLRDETEEAKRARDALTFDAQAALRTSQEVRRHRSALAAHRPTPLFPSGPLGR
jgi:hypothetical protein